MDGDGPLSDDGTARQDAPESTAWLKIPGHGFVSPALMSSDRDALRRELRQRRRAIPAAQRIAAADALAERLRALPFLPASGYAAGYWAMDGEIGLHNWQLRLPAGLIYWLWCCARTTPWGSRPGVRAMPWSPTASAFPSPTSSPPRRWTRPKWRWC